MSIRTLLPLVLALGLAGCAAESAPPPAPGGTSRPVVLATPQFPTETRSVRAIGRLEASQEADLGFATGGVVARVAVEIGDRVRAGQVLAYQDSTALDAGVAQARDQLAQARRDVVRLQGLIDRQLIARQQYDDARTRVELAESALRAAGYAQRYARIVAAADGVVLARLAEPGEVVAAAQPVLRVSAGDGGWLLSVELADRDGALVRPGDTAEVEIDALPGRRVPARVLRVGGQASARSGAIAVELRIEAPADAADRLRSGLVAKARIPLRGEATATIPTSALIEADLGRGVVFVAEQGRDGLHARRRSLRLGPLRGDTVQVLDALPADARVIVAGAAYLYDGAAVHAVPAASPASTAVAGPARTVTAH